MEKKTVKKAVKKVETAKKPIKVVADKKIEKASKNVPIKTAAESGVADVNVVKNYPKKGKVTLNEELNLLIGLFSLVTIITFCFAFQGGKIEVLGWELFLKAGEYSGVFKGLMIVYVAAIFIDCILSIRLDTENEIINAIEKALYMFTLVVTFIVNAVLLSIISNIGIGLIIFMILSIVSVIIKLVRIYAQNK